MRSPRRHCQIAECSLSTGRSRSSGSPSTRSSAAATRCPPVTSASLLASATILPAPSAWITAGSAAIPVVATTTRSTPSTMASSSSPPAAQRSPASDGGRPPGTQASASGQACSWARKASLACPAASARTRKRSACIATTSRVCRPIEPVDPSTAIPSTGLGHEAREEERVSGENGSREQERIDAVEDAPVPRDQEPGLLAPCGPLQHRLSQVPGLRGQTHDWADHQRVPGRKAYQPSTDAGRGGGQHQATGQPFGGLGWADVVDETGTPEPAAGEIGAGVVAPYDHHEQDWPRHSGAQAERPDLAGGGA